MASSSIFRSFTLPNGKEMRTMRDDVRAKALQAVKNKKASSSQTSKKSASIFSESSLEHTKLTRK